jgi:hypothetical protein
MGPGKKVYQYRCEIQLKGKMAIDSSAQTQYGGSIKKCISITMNITPKIAPQSIQYNQTI